MPQQNNNEEQPPGQPAVSPRWPPPPPPSTKTTNKSPVYGFHQAPGHRPDQWGQIKVNRWIKGSCEEQTWRRHPVAEKLIFKSWSTWITLTMQSRKFHSWYRSNTNTSGAGSTDESYLFDWLIPPPSANQDNPSKAPTTCYQHINTYLISVQSHGFSWFLNSK